MLILKVYCLSIGGYGFVGRKDAVDYRCYCTVAGDIACSSEAVHCNVERDHKGHHLFVEPEN